MKVNIFLAITVFWLTSLILDNLNNLIFQMHYFEIHYFAISAGNTVGRKRTASGRFMDTINPLLSFSTDDIADMDREVRINIHWLNICCFLYKIKIMTFLYEIRLKIYLMKVTVMAKQIKMRMMMNYIIKKKSRG